MILSWATLIAIPGDTWDTAALEDKAKGVTATGLAKRNGSIAGITPWPGPCIENPCNNSDVGGDDK